MQKVTVRINAKINLTLNITGVNGGYHALDSVMSSISLYDEITVEKVDGGDITVSFSACAVTNSNVHKVARLMRERFNLSGMNITVTQNIPMGGGLGGSSADACGAVRAINELFALRLSEKAMQDIALTVGSDTAFMISGGYARVGGRGENVRKIDSDISVKLLLAGIGEVNTGECFQLFDSGVGTGVVSDNAAMERALIIGDEQAIAAHLGNALQAAGERLNGSVRSIINIMSSCGLTACMTGSGAYVFGLGDDKSMNKAAASLKEIGISAVVAHTQNIGYKRV